MNLATLRQAARRELVRRAWARDERFFPRRDGKEYLPSKGQLDFHNSTARFRALFGGRGSGKTTAGAQEANMRIAKGLSGAIMNPDFENFKISTWPEARKWIPWEHVVERDAYMQEFGWEPHAAFTLHFDSGAVVFCKGLRDPDAARGPNINWLWYDEGGRDKTGLSFQLAVGGVRIGPDPGAWVTTTPKGARHWTARWFVFHELSDEALEVFASLGIKGSDLYSAHFASIHDNRANLDPLFYASMLSLYSGKFARQELDGQIVTMTEGLVYDNFGAGNVTALADFDIDRGSVELAADDGFSNSPRAFLFIQRDDDGTICIFDEIYHLRHQARTCIGEAKDMLHAHFVRAIAAIQERAIETRSADEEIRAETLTRELDEGTLARFEIAVCDPSAAQMIDAFRKEDVVARGSKCGIIEGIKRVHNLVCNDEGLRRILVHPRCKNFIQEMAEGYRYPDGTTSTDSTKPVKEDDHGPDALRGWVWMRTRRM